MLTAGFIYLSMLWMEEGKLPTPKGTVVYRPSNVDEREAIAKLPKITLISQKPASSLLKLAEQAGKRGAKLRSDARLYLLAAGPMLDGPDKVRVHALSRKDNELLLQVYHTSARLSGVRLRRNITWRPLVQIPIQLTPGNWQITVEWISYSQLPQGEPLAKPTVATARFEVADESK